MYITFSSVLLSKYIVTRGSLRSSIRLSGTRRIFVRPLDSRVLRLWQQKKLINRYYILRAFKSGVSIKAAGGKCFSFNNRSWPVCRRNEVLRVIVSFSFGGWWVGNCKWSFRFIEWFNLNRSQSLGLCQLCGIDGSSSPTQMESFIWLIWNRSRTPSSSQLSIQRMTWLLLFSLVQIQLLANCLSLVTSRLCKTHTSMQHIQLEWWSTAGNRAETIFSTLELGINTSREVITM